MTDNPPPLGPHDHIPMTVAEMVKMKGEAKTAAKAAMANRVKSERLFAEATQLIIDAEAFEKCARYITNIQAGHDR